MVLPLIMGAFFVVDMAVMLTTGKDVIEHVTGVDVYAPVVDPIVDFITGDSGNSSGGADTGIIMDALDELGSIILDRMDEWGLVTLDYIDEWGAVLQDMISIVIILVVVVIVLMFVLRSKPNRIAKATANELEKRGKI